MKYGKIILLILLVVFVGIQFVPTKRNESKSVLTLDFMSVYKVPQQIESKIKVSCYDCHSNHTNYPWYNTVQPVAWFLEDHINEGKAELNFNEWSTYSDRRKKSKLKSIVSQIKDDEMPLIAYKLIHRDARFSEKNKKDIINWVESLNKQ